MSAFKSNRGIRRLVVALLWGDALLLVIFALAATGCSSTQRLTFSLPTPMVDPSAVKERGSGVVFVAEPFCIAVSEGSSTDISIRSLGPAFLPIVPTGNSISGSGPRNLFQLVIELTDHGQPFELATRGLALHMDDGSLLAPASVQVSYFSSSREQTFTPLGHGHREKITWYHHDKSIVYSDLAPILNVTDTVRLTVNFAKPEAMLPVSLDFPKVSIGDGKWQMPEIGFSRVTRTKYNPGGGVTGDGIAVGTMPVTVCRELGYSHP